MENPNNVGNTSDYDGFGTAENGVDKTKNDLDSSYYEPQNSPAVSEEYKPGANAAAIAEDIKQQNVERGETALTASKVREEALNVSYDEKAKLEEAHEKDPTNEKIIAALKQVEDYIKKLIREFDNPPENINTISSRQVDSMGTSNQIDSKKGTPESIDNPREPENNSDLAYLGKDNFIYETPQDAIDSFAA